MFYYSYERINQFQSNHETYVNFPVPQHALQTFPSEWDLLVGLKMHWLQALQMCEKLSKRASLSCFIFTDTGINRTLSTISTILQCRTSILHFERDVKSKLSLPFSCNVKLDYVFFFFYSSVKQELFLPLWLYCKTVAVFFTVI